MTFCPDILKNYQQFKSSHLVELGDKSVIEAHGEGQITCKLGIDGNFSGESVNLHGVLFVPTLGKNLLSVPNLAKYGVSVMFERASCEFLRENRIIGRTTLSSESMYHLPVSVCTESAMVALTKDSMDIWHARLGHLNREDLKKFIAGAGKVVEGVKNVKLNDIFELFFPFHNQILSQNPFEMKNLQCSNFSKIERFLNFR